tara:strand:- start:539 stop:3994 length:3456 start_codon:yes stop_codon:yes gene_type:complete
MSETSLNLQEANPFLERIQDKVQQSKLIESMYESGGNPMPELEDFLRSLETDQIKDYFNHEMKHEDLSTESLNLYLNYLEQKQKSAARAKQDNLDYDTGVPNKLFRYNLARMDTAPEKEAYLTKTIGQEGIDWGMDKGGRYYLTESGLSNLNNEETFLPEGIDGLVIDESRPLTGADWVEFGAYSPQIIGGVGMGLRFSGYGFIPGVIASGVGETAGYFADEMVEFLQGYQNQPLFPNHTGNQSVMGSAAWNFAYGAGGEGFVRLLRPLGRMFTDPQGGFITWRPNAPLTEKGAKAILSGNRDEIMSAFPDLETKLKSTHNVSGKELDALVDAAIQQMRVKILGGFIYKEPGKYDLYNPHSSIKSKVDPSKQKAIMDVLEGQPHRGVKGGVSSISQSTPRTLLGYIQGTLERVFGNARDAVNRKFLENSMLVLKARAAGMSDKEIYEYIVNSNLPKNNPMFMSSAQFGEMISKKLGGQKMGLTAAVDLSNREIQGILNETLKALDNIGPVNKDVFDHLASSLTSAKTAYNVKFTSVLHSIDKEVGEGIFDSAALKTAVKDIVDFLPTKEIQKEITENLGPTRKYGTRTRVITETVLDDTMIPKEIMNFFKTLENAKPNMTGTNVQAYETIINTLVENPNLVKTIPYEKLIAMSSAIDNVYNTGIAKAGNLAQDTPAGKNVLNNLIKALENRSKVGKKIAKINSGTLLKLAQSGQDTALISADSVFANMIKTGDSRSLNKLFKLLDPADAIKLKAGASNKTLANIMEASKDVNGTVNVTKLLNNWKKLPTEMKTTLFPTQNLTAINNAMFRLNKFSGTLDRKALDELAEALRKQDGGSEMIGTLTKHVAAKENLDAFMKQNWKKTLSDVDNVQFEQAIDAIFQPKSGNLVNQVLKHFEGDEFITNAIKTKSMEKILRASVDATDNFNIIYSGMNLNKVLDKYGVNTLHKMFGKEMTGDLFEFAKQLNLISQGKNKGAGSIVAANLALSPLRKGVGAFGHLLTLGIIAKVLARPGLLKYLAFGMKGNTRAHAEALARVKSQITASGALESTAERNGKGPRQYIESGEVQNLREDLPVDSPITPGFDIPYVPLAQNQSAPPVEGSRLASANIAPPLIDPSRAAIAFGPMDILAQPRSAAQGGIMSTNKAFQRVA